MPILNWLNRDEHLKIADRVPYRILEEVSELGYGDPDAGNLLIQGDNLDTLKALLPFYAGQVKCIYIDPPYNTKSAFAHYDDNIEHSTWLGTLWARLKLLKDLLRGDGSIWISIDDDECHYLKVVCDEVFGRQNFVWKKSYGGGSKSRWVVGLHEHILCYARNLSVFPDMWLPPDPAAVKKYYKFTDEKLGSRGPFRLQPLATTSMDERKNLRYPIPLPDGREVWPEKQWQWSKDRVLKALANNELVITEKGKKVTVSYKQYLRDADGDERGRKPTSIIEGYYTQHGTYESMELFGLSDKFSFPKPEGLIAQIFESATNPGDLVLDSFLGSGTTAAVAHKMGRRWIGIEMGEHAKTHCAARLRKVVDGESGGISQAVNWSGGGGFRFFRLGGEVFETDGRIKSGITFNQLAAHIWFSETYTPWRAAGGGRRSGSTFLGVHEETAYALLYNGVLGDRAPAGGNVLTSKTLQIVKHDIGETPYKRLVIYGECALGSAWKQARIDFRQIPYDVKAR
jgi:adenine-specific DNA-methyltransferase